MDSRKKYGEGGFGAVHGGTYTPPGGSSIPAALKVVSLAKCPDMHREFLIMLDLPPHRNVVKLFGYAQTARSMVLVMEALTGGDLQRISEARPFRTLRTRLELAVQAADGLAHLHAQGIVHGDVKPANVVCDAAGVAKLVDLGLAAAVARTEGDAGFYGTLNYAAPELFPGGRGFTGRSRAADVWAFGMLLFALFTGRQPFHEVLRGESSTRSQAHPSRFFVRVYELLRGGMRPAFDKDGAAATAGPGGERLPPDLVTLACECWTLDPRHRPSMREVLTRLQGIQEQVDKASRYGRRAGMHETCGSRNILCTSSVVLVSTYVG